ncbi:ParA family protein [Massilia orientalis]|uniref:ParA family protein n=1 Tax=Massilia orientalis TaxID=3050128 RepID=A0ACC7MJC3_9BURK|nr:ParA family protein [Massilia sp. YIM B02787]
MKTFMPANQKGGVGKTTTGYNFTHYAAEKKHRSALVDADEQGNATKAMAPYAITEFNAADLFSDKPLPLPEEFPRLVLIPTDRVRLRDVEQSELDDMQLLENLRARLAELAPHFDYMTFDTPGSNSRIANAFLAVSDFVIVPCKIDPFSVDVSAEVLRRIKFIQRHFNPDLVNFGILANEFDARQPAQVQDFKELLASHHQYMFPKPIMDRQAYREAAGAQVPVWQLKEGGAGENRQRIKSAARDAGKEMRAVFDILLGRMESTGV